MRTLTYFFMLFNFLFSQTDYLNWYNHPELNWKTIETNNFLIHYHQGCERSAREAATIAEKVYKDITELYDYKPDSKTAIIITDYEDYSNGAAYYNFNKMVISAKPLDFYLRGSHRWLQNVITHEFTHIVQVGAALKYSRFFPYSYFQVLSYAEERREDVVYGFPNQIVSYPISHEVVPPWFAEGTAQVMYEKAYYDYWDSMRDMVLRDRVFYNTLLTFDQMNTFGKKGMGHESVYNQGFSLVKYIADKHGEKSLGLITQELSKPLQYSISDAIEEIIDINGYELYEEWKEKINAIYTNQIKNIKDKQNYEIIESEGYSNIHPKWSPDGKKIAFLSDKNNDYFGKSDLFIYNIEDSLSEKIKSGIRTSVTWVNDSLIVYAKRSDPNKDGSIFFNLYKYDLIEEEEEQLTEDSRLVSPLYHKETNQIFSINTYDGTSNIVSGELSDSIDFKQITNFDNGIHIFTLSINEDMIVFDAVLNHERDFYYLNIKNNDVGLYEQSNWDSRNFDFSKRFTIHSNDKEGIFNLFYKDENKEGFITNVIGGAFMPNISKDDRIVFSIFDNGKYNLAIMDDFDIIDERVGYSNNLERSDFLNLEFQNSNNSFYDRPSSDIINEGTNIESKTYVNSMMGPFIIPRVTIDYNTFKPGFYFFDSEYLDKTSVMGGFSMNSQKDIDISLFFDYNEETLSYFFNFYWVTKNLSRVHPYINSNKEVIPSINWHVDYKYELFSADIGSRYINKDHKFWFKYTYSKYRQYNYPNQVHCYEDNGQVCEEQHYKYAHDYYRGHAFTIDYRYDARKKDFLYRYTMFPKNGYIIDSSISYEKNKVFEGFKANDAYGGFLEDLKDNNLVRYKLDISHYWDLDKKGDDIYILKSNFKYFTLSDESVDDFFYFFGGGIFGMRGYTFFEPTLQGTESFLVSNTITKPFFVEKNIKLGWIYLNSLSLSLTHQFGKSSNGKIKLYSGKFLDANIINEEGETNQDIVRYLQLSEHYDGLDVDDIIPDEYEEYIFPDIYHEYDVVEAIDNLTDYKNLHSIKELKERYNSIKQSLGLELKILGFSFYSYPTALTYEYHIPINDPWNKKGQQYLKVLFDFE